MVVGLVGLFALVGLYFLFGMPGMGHGSGGMQMDGDSMPAGEHRAGPPTRLDPAAFARELDSIGTVVVNVHTPYEGEIPGTDAFIAFDRVAGHAGLPADKQTRVALYCRSGRMSAIAARTLRREGYREVVELEGGMEAWRAAGLPTV